MSLLNIKILLCIISLCTLFLISTAAGDITNPGFETGDLTGWFDIGNVTVGTDYAYSGNYGCRVKTPGAPSSWLGQTITLSDTLSFNLKILDVSESNVLISWQGSSPSGNFNIEEFTSTQGWQREYIDTSAWNGYYGNLKFSVTSNDPGSEFWLDDLSTTELPTLSGYVKDNYGDPIGPAYLSLNESGGSTESNDSGYYEITDITIGTYLLTVTSGNNYDYTAVVDITSDTEHNVTMTRKLPDFISGPSIIDESATSLTIGWTENSVVDSVKIYQGTNTNLIYTMDTSYTYTNYHEVSSLDYETQYTFWVQPLDGTVAGTKYEITGTTDAWDVSIPPPVGTTTPTPIPPIEDDNETIIGDIIEIITELLPEPLKELPEKVLEIIEETITYVSTPFNWILLITAYVGAFIGKSIFNDDEDYAEIITSTLLLGTIGWIIVLLINFFVPIISQNEVISILIFTTSGFIIAAIASSIQPETETRAPRRPHT